MKTIRIPECICGVYPIARELFLVYNLTVETNFWKQMARIFDFDSGRRSLFLQGSSPSPPWRLPPGSVGKAASRCGPHSV